MRKFVVINDFEVMDKKETGLLGKIALCISISAGVLVIVVLIANIFGKNLNSEDTRECKELQRLSRSGISSDLFSPSNETRDFCKKLGVNIGTSVVGKSKKIEI